MIPFFALSPRLLFSPCSLHGSPFPDRHSHIATAFLSFPLATCLPFDDFGFSPWRLPSMGLHGGPYLSSIDIDKRDPPCDVILNNLRSTSRGQRKAQQRMRITRTQRKSHRGTRCGLKGRFVCGPWARETITIIYRFCCRGECGVCY